MLLRLGWQSITEGRTDFGNSARWRALGNTTQCPYTGALQSAGRKRVSNTDIVNDFIRAWSSRDVDSICGYFTDDAETAVQQFLNRKG